MIDALKNSFADNIKLNDPIETLCSLDETYLNWIHNRAMSNCPQLQGGEAHFSYVVTVETIIVFQGRAIFGCVN